MKRTAEDVLMEEYNTYIKECKKPKPFFEWATNFKASRIKALKNELEKWEAYEPKNKKVVIKIKKTKKEAN